MIHIKEGNSFYRFALNLTLILVAQQLVLNLIAIIDNLMLGSFGDLFIASAAVSNRLFNVPSNFLNGILSVVSVFIAQYIGSKDTMKMKQVFRFGLIFSFLFMLPFILAGLFLPHSMLALMTQDKDLIDTASIYIRYLALSMIPFILSQAIHNAVRSYGHIKPLLFTSILTIILKVCFNFLFLYSPWQWSLSGAGLAMLLSRLIEALVLIAIVFINKYPFLHHKEEKISIPRPLAHKITKLMLPIGINELFFGLGLAMIFKGYTYSASLEVATGYSIAMTYHDFFRVLVPATGTVLTILMAPYLGRGEYDEAEETAIKVYKLSLGIGIVFAVLLGLSAFTVPYLFDSSELSLHVSRRLIMIMGVLFPLNLTHGWLYYILRGGGDTRSIFMMDSLFMWLVIIPLIFFLGNYTDLSIFWIYGLVEASYIFKCILALRLINTGRWRSNLTKG